MEEGEGLGVLRVHNIKFPPCWNHCPCEELLFSKEGRVGPRVKIFALDLSGRSLTVDIVGRHD